VNPQHEAAINVRMAAEYTATPVGEWQEVNVECYLVRPYANAHQLFWVTFDLEKRTMTVYSFTKSFTF
jgi:hypothetical protein